jgi:two-component system chemotaxis response regulator CheY
MPQMTGVEVLRRLRANGEMVPFGLVTSESTSEMRQAAQDAGALFLITKPFTVETFRDVLEPILG